MLCWLFAPAAAQAYETADLLRMLQAPHQVPWSKVESSADRNILRESLWRLFLYGGRGLSPADSALAEGLRGRALVEAGRFAVDPQSELLSTEGANLFREGKAIIQAVSKFERYDTSLVTGLVAAGTVDAAEFLVDWVSERGADRSLGYLEPMLAIFDVDEPAPESSDASLERRTIPSHRGDVGRRKHRDRWLTALGRAQTLVREMNTPARLSNEGADAFAENREQWLNRFELLKTLYREGTAAPENRESASSAGASRASGFAPSAGVSIDPTSMASGGRIHLPAVPGTRAVLGVVLTLCALLGYLLWRRAKTA